MAPLIPDGIYKIRNGKYDDKVVSLRYGRPGMPIAGETAHPSKRNDKWRITNTGWGGNTVTIESMFHPGIYADPDQPIGNELIGFWTRTEWTIVKVDGGMYYLQNPEADRVWQLPNGSERTGILIVPHTGQIDTKWTFDRVGA